MKKNVLILIALAMSIGSSVQAVTKAELRAAIAKEASLYKAAHYFIWPEGAQEWCVYAINQLNRLGDSPSAITYADSVCSTTSNGANWVVKVFNPWVTAHVKVIELKEEIIAQFLK